MRWFMSNLKSSLVGFLLMCDALARCETLPSSRMVQ